MTLPLSRMRVFKHGGEWRISWVGEAQPCYARFDTWATAFDEALEIVHMEQRREAA